MPIPLRPAIAVAALLVTGVAVLGGVLLYLEALDAVGSALDQAESNMADSLKEAAKQAAETLTTTVEQAAESLQNGVDEGSNADIRLFASALKPTFTSVEQVAAQLEKEVTMNFDDVPPGPDALQTINDILWREDIAIVLAAQEQNHERVTGIGIYIFEANSSLKNEPTSRTVMNFAWWDPMPGVARDHTVKGGGRSWYVQKSAIWQEEELYFYDAYAGTSRCGYEALQNDPDPDCVSSFVSKYWTLTFGDDSAVTMTHDDEEGQESMVAHKYETWPGIETPGAPGYWSAPQTWAIDGIDKQGLCMYIKYDKEFIIPDRGPLAGMVGQAEAETDLAHWDAIVEDYLASAKPKGSYAVVDFRQSFVLRHTTEPAPDMIEDPDCAATDEDAPQGPACFPQLKHYSNVTQFAARELLNATYDVLHVATHNGTKYYLRKHPLQVLGDGYVLDILWFRDSREVQQELEERRDAAQERADTNMRQLRTQADANLATLRSAAEEDVNDALVVMIIVMAVAFVINCVVSAGWVVLLARPLSRVQHAVMLMGDMKLDEAKYVYGEGSGGCEVSEVKELGDGFIVAVKLLEQYRDYLPSSVLIEDAGEEEDAPKSPGLAPKSSMGSMSKGAAASKGRDKSEHRTQTLQNMQQKKDALGTGVQKKNISFIVSNIVGWQRASAGLSTGDLLKVHSAAVEKMMQTYQSFNGMPEVFQGDRMSATFNAVRTTGNHRQLVCNAANAMADCVPEKKVSVAAGCDTVRAGNLGCPGMKKYTVLAPMVPFVYALERINNASDTRVIAEDHLQGAVGQFFFMRVVEFVTFEKYRQQPVRAWELIGLKNAGEDEWMYQLEEAEKNDPYAAWNKFADSVLTGASYDGLPGATAAGDEKGGKKIPPPVYERFSAACNAKSFKPKPITMH